MPVDRAGSPTTPHPPHGGMEGLAGGPCEHPACSQAPLATLAGSTGPARESLLPQLLVPTC